MTKKSAAQIRRAQKRAETRGEDYVPPALSPSVEEKAAKSNRIVPECERKLTVTFKGLSGIILALFALSSLSSSRIIAYTVDRISSKRNSTPSAIHRVGLGVRKIVAGAMPRNTK